MAYKNPYPLESFVAGHSATNFCHCKTCDYLLIGKRQLYPQVRSLRPLSSNVEHAPRHHSEESTNIPETTLHSSIGPPPTFIPSPLSFITPLSPSLFSSLPTSLSQSDPSSSSRVWGHPTSTSGVSQSKVPSPSTSSLILTPSNVALASGKLQNMPTVTPTVENTHVGIIVGSVVGGLVAILLGVAVWYYLFRKNRNIKGRRRKIGYNNLQTEDERPYLLGPEGDENWVRYPQIDDTSIHNEQGIDDQGRYTSLLQQSRPGVHYSYPLSDMTPNYRHMTISSAGGEELRSVLVRDHNGLGVRRSDVEELMPQQHNVESDSRANGPAERETYSGLDAHASSRGSILSWARSAFSLPAASVLTGYHPTSSRTTVVDIDQISWPRRLQKWQRPLQPKRGAG